MCDLQNRLRSLVVLQHQTGSEAFALIFPSLHRKHKCKGRQACLTICLEIEVNHISILTDKLFARNTGLSTAATGNATRRLFRHLSPNFQKKKLRLFEDPKRGHRLNARKDNQRTCVTDYDVLEQQRRHRETLDRHGPKPNTSELIFVVDPCLASPLSKIPSLLAGNGILTLRPS